MLRPLDVFFSFHVMSVPIGILMLLLILRCTRSIFQQKAWSLDSSVWSFECSTERFAVYHKHFLSAKLHQRNNTFWKTPTRPIAVKLGVSVIVRPVWHVSSYLPTGSCTSSLNHTRTRSRRWAMRQSRLRNRRAKPQLAGYATKPSLLTAVATSVHIAKRNSVLDAEDECLCGQIR